MLRRRKYSEGTEAALNSSHRQSVSLTPLEGKLTADGANARTGLDPLYKVMGGKVFKLFQESGLEMLQNRVEAEKSTHYIHVGSENAGNCEKRTNLTIIVQRGSIERGYELMVVVKEVKTAERFESLNFVGVDLLCG